MNGRRLFRKYAQSKGKEATGFVKIEKYRQRYYWEDDEDYDQLITFDSKGKFEFIKLDYRDMVEWIVRQRDITIK